VKRAVKIVDRIRGSVFRGRRRERRLYYTEGIIGSRGRRGSGAITGSRRDTEGTANLVSMPAQSKS